MINPVFGKSRFFQGYHYAVSEDDGFMKAFVLIMTKLLQEGKVKALDMLPKRGGKKLLKGALHGIQEMVEGKASGGKLIYTRE